LRKKFAEDCGPRPVLHDIVKRRFVRVPPLELGLEGSIKPFVIGRALIMMVRRRRRSISCI